MLGFSSCYTITELHEPDLQSFTISHKKISLLLNTVSAASWEAFPMQITPGSQSKTTA